jgi:hypothetical protein
MELLLFLIFILVIQILTAERQTGTQQNNIYWQAAKQLYYNNNISKSNNKIKTTCDIIKMETCKNHTNRGTGLINMDGNLITDNKQLQILSITTS